MRAPPPPAAQRIADVLLAVVAVGVPLSTTAMQAGVLALTALTAVGFAAGWRVARPTPLDGPLMLFLAVLACSTLASGHPLQARGWGRLWVLVTFPATAWWLRDRAQVRRLALLLVAAGAIVAVYGIVQHFTGVDWYRQLLRRARVVRPRTPGQSGFAAVGFFRSYLTFGHVMLFPLGWALAARLSGRRWAGPAALAIVVAIVFSTSRGAWLGALGIAGALGLVVRRRAALLLLGAVVGLGGVALLASPALRQEAAGMFALDGVNTGRIAIYRANLAIIHDHPWLGLGFGRYATAARPYYDAEPAADRRSHAHNDYLQIAAEAGLLGLAAFALMFARALVAGWPEPGPDAWVQGGAWAALVGFLVGGLTQYSFDDHEVAVALWFTLALLLHGRTANGSGVPVVAPLEEAAR